jgi:hypothetical protein
MFGLLFWVSQEAAGEAESANHWGHREERAESTVSSQPAPVPHFAPLLESLVHKSSPFVGFGVLWVPEACKAKLTSRPGLPCIMSTISSALEIWWVLSFFLQILNLRLRDQKLPSRSRGKRVVELGLELGLVGLCLGLHHLGCSVMPGSEHT